MMFKQAHRLLLLSCLFIAACGGGSSDSGGDSAPVAVTPDPVAVTKVLAISDSLGTGFGIATPWPPRLANALGVTVINNSESGEPTSYGVRVIQDLITSEQPTHVVILLGTNDAIRESVSGAISNLQEMVNIASSNNVTAIVATLPPITRSSTENSRAAQISDGIRSLSGAQIADIRTVLSNSDIADGVHPNDGGQQKIADTIASLF